MSNFIPSIETFAKGTFATAAGATTLGVGLLYYGQNFLIYPSAFPPGSRTEVPVPSDYSLPYEDLKLITPDNVTLRCYLLLQRKNLAQAVDVEYLEEESDSDFASSRPTIVMFHGNGGNHGHRIPLAKVFYLKMRCNVLMMSYRGYGLSDGTPSEKGLCIDAQTALDYITSDATLSKTPIVLFGQSIGGAVSIDLANRNPEKIAGLILENTFLSLPRLIPHALPLLSRVSFLCHQKWDSATKLAKIRPYVLPTQKDFKEKRSKSSTKEGENSKKKMGVLMLSGLRDEVVPAEHMRGLWEILTGQKGGGSVNGGMENVKFVEFEKGAHNDTFVQPGYWNAVADFVARLGDD